MKKHSIFLLLFTFFSCFISGIGFANAATLVETDSKYLEENGYNDSYTLYLYWVHDNNISWNETDNTYKSGNLYWPYKEFAVDGITSYCIEPFVSTPSDYENPTENDYNSYLASNWENIDEDLRAKISLIAYYGYDYTGHKTSKYRLATQALIWETLLRENTAAPWLYTPNANYTVSFYIHPTGEGYKYQKNGSLVDIASEKAEILRLVQEHNILPSFANNEQALSASVGTTAKFTDTNNLLYNFEIEDLVDNNIIKLENNTLAYSPNTYEEITLTFKRKAIYNQSYIIYSGGVFQNLIATGEPTKTTFSVKLKSEIIEKEVTIVKKDADTKETIKKAGIMFKIYDTINKKYILNGNSDIFMTDATGSFKVSLPLGSYRLEEVDQHLDGYLWNKESLNFEVTTTNDNLEISFINKAVKGSIEINKTGEVIEIGKQGFVYTETNLEGVKFGLYAKENIYDSFNNLVYNNGDEVGTYVTDSNGKINISNLFLGKYYLLELETKDNYILDDKIYDIEILYQDQYKETVSYKNIFKNYLKKGTVEFIKKDAMTLEELANTVIEIYTENGTLVFTGKTDINGQIIINNLPLGKYYVLEKVAPIGYELNMEKMTFEITQNGEVVNLTMFDKKMKALEVVKVGNTSHNDNSMLFIGILFILGIGLIIYDKLHKTSYI